MTEPDSRAENAPPAQLSAHTDPGTRSGTGEISLAVVSAELTARFEQAGIASAQTDAELLLARALEISRAELALALATDKTLPAEAAARLAPLADRREAREPLQHILGIAYFRHLELEVGPGVFVPRPETEMLVQLAMERLSAFASPAPIAVDLGTGSGAIALALATEVPHAQVYAVEKSEDAIVWTRRNNARYDNPITLIQGDLAVAFAELNGTVSVVVSNPPYIPAAAVPRDPEVRNFDPELALYGGEDGLDIVRQVSATAQRLLHPGGALLIEPGELQGQEIRELLTADGWRGAETHTDLTLRDRFTTATK